MEEEMHGMIPARGGRLAGALLGWCAVAALAAGAASATPVANVSPAVKSVAVAKVHYAPPTSEEYTFVYTGTEFYGPVSCTGHHETNERKGYAGTPGPPPGEGGRDVEVCTSTTGMPLVGMVGGEKQTDLIEGYSEWGSDWDGNAIVSTNFHYKVSHNDRSFKIVAYYPAPA
jgi:hypothetical protein